MYLGSKRAMAPRILPIILRNRGEKQCFVEPFCGGGNITQFVKNPRVANDANEYVVALLNKMSRGKFSDYPMLSKDDYADMVKNPKNYEKAAVGFYGTQMTFSAMFLDSWYEPNAERLRWGNESCVKKAPLLRGVEWQRGDYRIMLFPPDSLIYCDPPYIGTRQGYGVAKWSPDDHAAFFEWARFMATAGHDVFVSEESAPPDWIAVWRYDWLRTNSNVQSGSVGKLSTEKLFIHESAALRPKLADFIENAKYAQKSLDGV